MCYIIYYETKYAKNELAFLPPVIAYQYEIVGYVYIATLAVSPP